MDNEPEEETALGGLSAVETTPGASSTGEEPEDSYWLAQYYTQEKDDGVWLMAVKYSGHLPKEKVEKAAKEVRARDRYAAKGIPLEIKKVSTSKVSTSSTLPGAGSTTNDWTVQYRVYDSPTSLNSKTVRLNYSGVFTEDEVRAHANKAVASHEHTVPDTFFVDRYRSDSSSSDSYLAALNADKPYPLLQDKDWLKKMTQSVEEPKRRAEKRKSGVLRASSGERRSLRVCERQKAAATEGDEHPIAQPERELEPTPGPSQTEEEAEPGPGASQKEPSPQPSTSKKSKKATTSAKERFKGKVFQVKDAT